jgi:pilus assembly protein Flp/PilA
MYYFHPARSMLIYSQVIQFHPDKTLEGDNKHMRKLTQLVVAMQIWKDRKGQDLIEYALMAGFVAVAAGAIMPGVASSINIVFSKVNSVMVQAAAS